MRGIPPFPILPGDELFPAYLSIFAELSQFSGSGFRKLFEVFPSFSLLFLLKIQLPQQLFWLHFHEKVEKKKRR
jgi:hypothetical protein